MGKPKQYIDTGADEAQVQNAKEKCAQGKSNRIQQEKIKQKVKHTTTERDKDIKRQDKINANPNRESLVNIQFLSNSNQITTEVSWICKLPVNPTGCKDFKERPLTLINQLRLKKWALKNSSAVFSGT